MAQKLRGGLNVASAVPTAKDTRAAITLAVGSIGLLILLHVSARACRDALFFRVFDVRALPKAMLAAATTGLLAVTVSSRAMVRFGPARVVAIFLVLSSAAYWLEWRFVRAWPKGIVGFLYVHASVAGGIAVSGFWSIVNERFDPHTVRKSTVRLAAGAATGGLVGGLVARAVGSRLGLEPMLLLLSGCSLVAAGGALTLAPGVPVAKPTPAAPVSERSRTAQGYLLQMATLVALIGVSGALVDFAFKTTVASALPDSGSLVSFFALFYMLVSVAAVGLQLLVTPGVLSRYGIGVGLGVLPASVSLLALVGVVLPLAPLLVLLRGLGVALEGSLFRAAYEPLYAPLPVAEKRAKKGLIDVACDRLGEALGSGAMLGCAALAPALGVRVGLGLAVLASGSALLLSSRLERGYVGELAASLREGRLELGPEEAADATTRLTLSQTQLEIDRATLVRQIEALRHAGSTRALAPSSRVAARLAALGSGDKQRILAALADGPLEPELVSLVIPLLFHDELADATVAALKSVASRVPGQLVDALLDRELPLKLRRRIPRVLRTARDPRAVRGLSEALFAEHHELRLRSALALRDITRDAPELGPPRRVVLDACLREIQESPDVALDQVTTLLGLVIEAEPLELAFQALASNEPKLRGTALEYLENVIPEPVRSAVWPLLQAERPHPAAARDAKELAAELRRSLG